MGQSEEEREEAKRQRFIGFEEDLNDIEVPETLPILPLRGVVIFPSAIVPLLISRGSSLKVVEQVLAGDRMLGVVAQKNPEEEAPTPETLYSRGTAGRVLKMLKYPDGSVRILVQGLRRTEVVEYLQLDPFFQARVRLLSDLQESTGNTEAIQAHMVNQFAKYVAMIPFLPDELQVVVMNIKDPGKVTDLIASNLNISLEEKQELLSTLDVRQRMERLSTILNREIELLELGHKIQSQVQSELTKNQKEFYLRQQMRAIQKELGEGDPRAGELDDLRKKLDDAKLPPEALKAAENEFDRLRIIPPESAEHTVVRTYLEWLVNLPWSVSTEDNLDIPHARQILDEDHYDLEKIKDRILEYLAVRQLKADSKGPILCFVGPPGTGKTSLGRSIARAMGRKFVRMSLGGVRDEAEIRGHRRTYIGSLPGRIIQNLRTAASNNPLIILDEIDKLGADFRGDPASALLEVLDPEQNNTFVDHYLDVPFDLSKVMFVTTANLLDPIPPPLRDRMEIIELAGYTEDEKLHIARRHLIPKQMNENGLLEGQINFNDDGLYELIRHYTREAGLRNLEREIGSLCRKVARRVTEGKKEPVVVDAKTVQELLGPERYFSEIAERTQEPGVAIGLAWTPMGGDIMFMESTKMTGKKGLTLTGHLGDVMKESAQAALSYIRAHAEALGIAPDFFENVDIHVHVPAGAVP
ncbi:MAG TPA: endopeptidase La, partial [Candidatus Acidoferrales bacterium]|nr:endopeptidase La [Candidatus Acidoferrales bacterium]